ncbi:MAG: patatin-like phospholipase family protein [Gammaproteobacteria bacterium]|nr:patatin-like phospholipase family protein [Gammaproteobacteria bacterium]
MKKLSCLYSVLLVLLLTGCTTYGVIDNTVKTETETDEEKPNAFSWKAANQLDRNTNLDLAVSFSGGGTRAAALAYGVLKGLRDTTIEVDGQSSRLLDQIDQISSVSGGSFTSAYYGLNGDGIFDTFEHAFLLRDVEKHLFWGLMNPIEWFRKGGRTEMAIRFYNDTVFHNATFSDFKKDGPLIVINASGLGNGVRFSFIEEYFDLFCSRLDNFPVAKAVAASSSVPIVFLPVVLEKYSDCDSFEPEWLKRSKAQLEINEDPLLAESVKGIEILLNKKRLRYIHLVDGGITDNLGLLALYDFVTLSGGAVQTLQNMKTKPPKYFVVISVNSSTDPNFDMDISNKEPSILDTINSMSDIQLHRFNRTTQALLEFKIKQWTKAISTPEHQVKSYFINVSLKNVQKNELRLLLNKIPTSFGLSKENIERLVGTGVNLLYQNPEYQRLLSDLQGEIGKK